MQDLVVAVTGASGCIYAVRLLKVLLAAGRTVHVTMSAAAVEVFRHELGIVIDLDHFDPSQLLSANVGVTDDAKLSSLRSTGVSSDDASPVFSDSEISPGSLIYHHFQDYMAGIASGSHQTGGMVICPCSMGT